MAKEYKDLVVGLDIGTHKVMVVVLAYPLWATGLISYCRTCEIS